uniref:Uncharacterized protein n=1 Tax=viral metagenome TaxID=1070528 RepID=A0A6C0B0N8_9ZZZZ
MYTEYRNTNAHGTTMSYYNEYTYSDNGSDAGTEYTYTSHANRDKANGFAADAPKDKLKFKITRNISEFEYLKKNVQITIFGSGQQGTTIRNAVTGKYYDGHFVGSANEYEYYKVALCTGEVGGGETVFLFYDSLQQYTSHMAGKLNPTSSTRYRGRRGQNY